MASEDLTWLLLRQYNSFTVKRKNTGSKIFSRESGNLRNLHSPKYSGLSNNKNLDVQLTKSGAYAITVRKEGASPNQVKSARSRQILKKSSGARKVVGQVAKTNSGYRPDLHKVAIARAGRLQSTSNPKPVKERSARGKKAAAAEEEA